MGTWPTLLGAGNAAVLGLPQGFSLPFTLQTAKEIRLATAFAHRSGWRFLKEPVHGSKATIFLLAGRDCYQTEPKLLTDWLQLKAKANGRVKAHLASDEAFFHPKVLVVTFEQPERDFAVVGSGNLSEGGLSKNTECSLFITDATAVKQVADWFDIEFRRGLELNEKLIAVYEIDYNRNKDKRIALTKRDAETGKKLKAAAEATMASWEEAVKAARKYFATTQFTVSYRKRQVGADEIGHALNAPSFDFDKNGLNAFFRIGPLGKLDPRSRDTLWRHRNRLKKALKQLAANPKAALPRVLNPDGDLHVPGAGLNTITKILAALFPQEWPVYNRRVSVALAGFGYKHPRGASPAEKYIAYRDVMRRFAGACGTKSTKPDALALDAFFLMRSRRVEKKHVIKKQNAR
jgi:HKD family nuclease